MTKHNGVGPDLQVSRRPIRAKPLSRAWSWDGARPGLGPVAAGGMEQTTFLADNLAALRAHAAPAAAWLDAHGAHARALASRLFVNRQGLPDWRLAGGSGLLETAPPLETLYADWRPGPEAHLDAGLAVGVGLGHGIARLLAASPPGYRLLALEPDPLALAACLSLADYRPQIEAGRLIFVPPEREALENEIARLDAPMAHGEIRLFADPLGPLLSPDLEQWFATTRGLLDNFAVDLGALREFQDAMTGNELDNYARARGHGSLRAMAGSARGATALVLGAGPSLETTGPVLAGHMAQAITVAALQTMPVVERLGIAPDFCLALDFRKDMLALYHGVKDQAFLERTPLVYSTKCHPEVVRRYPGPKLPLWTADRLAGSLMDGSEPALDAGNNVGVAMVRLLLHCGAERIVLAGQDFAWGGERSHAPGHHAHGRVRTFDPAKHIALQNRDGMTVYSNRAFLTSKRDLEKDVRRSDAAFHNVYGGAARIEGCPEISADECLSRGLLHGDPEAKKRFLAALAEAGRLTPDTLADPGFPGWSAPPRAAAECLKHLARTAQTPDNDAPRLLAEIAAHLRRPSPFAPLVFNQAVDLDALARLGAAQGPTGALAAQGAAIIEAALARAERLDKII
jgi:hypothetical protein